MDDVLIHRIDNAKTCQHVPKEAMYVGKVSTCALCGAQIMMTRNVYHARDARREQSKARKYARKHRNATAKELTE